MHCQFALGSTEEFCFNQPWPGLVDLNWAYPFVRSRLPDWLWISWSKVAQVDGWFHLLSHPSASKTRTTHLECGARQLKADRKCTNSPETQPQNSQNDIWVHFIKQFKSNTRRGKMTQISILNGRAKVCNHFVIYHRKQ